MVSIASTFNNMLEFADECDKTIEPYRHVHQNYQLIFENTLVGSSEVADINSIHPKLSPKNYRSGHDANP